jgi:L-glutamine-phosphate cytidylyltransferase
MRGIILAAGRGARLNGHRDDLPKCLVTVGDETLLSRNVSLLRAAGIDEVIVVVGCGADAVRQRCRGVTFVHNEAFADTNSLYSLWLARPFLGDGFVVMNCDVLVHPQLLSDLVTARLEDAALIAFREEDTTFGSEEMKVRVRCGRIAAMAKTIRPDEADGENVGIVKFGWTGAQLLIQEIDALIGAGERRAWAPRAFEAFARTRPLHAIGTRGYPWIEIDFPEDYRRAVEVVLPQIESDIALAHDHVPPPGVAPRRRRVFSREGGRIARSA